MNSEPKTRIWTGTIGLDAMLSYSAENWIPEAPGWDSNDEAQLSVGCRTLLIGPPGTGKTSVGWQFLIRQYGHLLTRTDGDIIDEYDLGKNELIKKDTTPVFVTFEHTTSEAEKQLATHWKRYWDIRPPYPKPKQDRIEVRNWLQKLPEAEVRKGFRLLAFRQAHIDPNSILAQLRECIAHDKPRRIFIDGLSTWVATFPSNEQPLILDAVMSLFREEMPASNIPTLFLTYDADLPSEQIVPSQLGIGAENIIVFRAIPLQDITRKVIYIAKASGLQHDRSVREVVFGHPGSDEEGPLRVIAGFDEFTDLLSGQPTQASVYLQFFAENHAEKAWNEWIREELGNSKKLNFRFLEITRTENARTHSRSERSSGAPASELRIMTVDEWWLSGYRGEETGLVPLRHLWPRDETASALPSWNDFWSFEVEKGTRLIDSCALAVPGHMDFGIFCFNHTVYSNWRFKHRDGLKPPSPSIACDENQVKELEDIAPLRVSRTLKINAGRVLPAHTKLKSQFDTRSLWLQCWRSAMQCLPGKWVPDNWAAGACHSLSNPAECGILGLLESSRREVHQPYLFAFDSSTPETCACFFLEMAWGFGAPWDFLAPEKPTHTGAVAALTFLQELVLRDFMPARGTIEDTTRAIFSRQWYSTLTYIRENEECQDGIVTLPFWPTGSWKDHSESALLRDALVDICSRLRKTHKRLHDALNKGKGDEEKDGNRCESILKRLLESPRPTLPKLQKLAKSLNRIANRIRQSLEEYENQKILKRPPQEVSEEAYSRSEHRADYRDLMEHVLSHFLRMRLISGYTNGESLMEAIEAWKVNPRDPGIWRKRIRGDKNKRGCLTGYGCSGSWLFAVHKSSRNVGLSREILAELTSAKTADKRAELGAGMPARKDFYHTSGDHPVPGIPHLSWRELLRFAGNRARNRTSAFASPGKAPSFDPSSVLTIIAERLLDLLHEAEIDRPPNATGLHRALEAAKARGERFCKDIRDLVITLRDEAEKTAKRGKK